MTPDYTCAENNRLARVTSGIVPAARLRLRLSEHNPAPRPTRASKSTLVAVQMPLPTAHTNNSALAGCMYSCSAAAVSMCTARK